MHSTWTNSVDLHFTNDVVFACIAVGGQDGQLDATGDSRGLNLEGLFHPTVRLVLKRDLWSLQLGSGIWLISRFDTSVYFELTAITRAAN